MAEAKAPLDIPKLFGDLTANESVDQQGMTFLRAFVVEFQGSFEQILTLAEEFKEAAGPAKGTVQELDEFEAHKFLEKKGETKTVKDLRDDLKEIDIDNNGSVAFIEYLLFKYKKTPTQLFEAKPDDALVKKLEEAIAKIKAHFAELKAKKEKEEELQGKADSGDVKAKAELRRMQMQDPAEDTKNELGALHAKMAAKRALRDPSGEQQKQFEEEQRRVEQEKRAADMAEKKKKADSRAKLKAKASLWN